MNALIWTNHRTYTAEECYAHGYRDGRDGTRFYPCTEWELVPGDRVRGMVHTAARAYAKGYKAGEAAAAS